jgi:hypothetical protein
MSTNDEFTTPNPASQPPTDILAGNDHTEINALENDPSLLQFLSEDPGLLQEIQQPGFVEAISELAGNAPPTLGTPETVEQSYMDGNPGNPDIFGGGGGMNEPGGQPFGDGFEPSADSPFEGGFGQNAEPGFAGGFEEQTGQDQQPTFEAPSFESPSFEEPDMGGGMSEPGSDLGDLGGMEMDAF